MKNKVVVFNENNARILINPENFEDWKDVSHALINPDLSAVSKLPPHLWMLENGKIRPMTGAEQHIRFAHIEKFGIDTSIPDAPKKPRRLDPMSLVSVKMKEAPGWYVCLGSGTLGILLAEITRWLLNG